MLMLVLAGCSTAPQLSGEALTFDDGEHDATLPPPTEITLESPDFAPVSRPFALTVPDALPDETVFFIGGGAEGDGPCPRPLGGYCMSLVAPLAFVGRAETDDAGVAVGAIDAPRFPGGSMCYQAVIRRGPEGLLSAFSNVHCVDFCADVDSDGDGRCDEFDICVGDSPTDADGDGRCDDIDICDGGDDLLDSDDDTVPDFCDLCAGDDATGDTDSDGTCDGSDICPFDPGDDSDGDSICDGEDICPGGDDSLDSDGDGVPDACDSSGLYIAEGRAARSYGGPYRLYNVALDTGAVTEIGDLGAGLTGLSVGPDGQMYAVQAEGRFNPNFYTLNVDSASLTFLSESSDAGSMSGFSWRGDELFAWTENGDDLGSVDLDSGTWTYRGVGGGSGGHCMATDAAGNMYRMSSGSLYLVTPDSGEVSLGGVSGGSFSSGGGACTFHEGVLYRNGTDEHLYAIDVVSLVATDTGIVMSEHIDAMGSFTP